MYLAGVTDVAELVRFCVGVSPLNLVAQSWPHILQVNSGGDDTDRVLIFGRASGEFWIEEASKIYVDGAFSLAPALLSRKFVILGERAGRVVSLCYALLPNEMEASYNKVG